MSGFPPNPSQSSPEEPAKTVIAVIDDTEENLYTTTRYLRRAGYEIWEGRSGKEALELAERQPDLIVLDVKMPDMLGYEACRKIKTNPETASIPVLHTSATFLETKDKVEGLEGGADGYLTAPLKPEEFVATVRSLLRMRAAEKRAETVAAQWQTTFDAIRTGVCLIDQEAKIERCNLALAEMVGRERNGLHGLSFFEFAELASIPAAPYERMRETRRRERLEAPSGDVWWRVTVDPVFDNERKLIGAVCVIADISEQRVSEAKIRRSEANLSEFFENAPIGLHWLDAEGRILRANQAELNMMGYSSDEYVGRKIEDFFVSKESFRSKLEKHHRGENVENFPAELRCKDGTIKEVLISANVFREEGKFVHTRSFVRDVTRQKRSERRLRTQYEATRLLIGAPSVDAAAPGLLKAICRTVGWGFGALWCVRGDSIGCVDVWKSPGTEATEFEARTRTSLFGLGESLPGHVWEKGKPVWAPDLAAQTDFHFHRLEEAVAEGFRAALAVPVLSGGEVLGVLEFFGEEIREPDEELLNGLESIAYQVGLFIDRISAERSLAQAQAELRAHAVDLEKRVAERTRKLEEQTRRLRHLAAELASAEQRERRRLAALLHDDLQQLLVAATMKTSTLGQYVSDERGTEAVEQARAWIEEATETARNLSRELRPPALYEGGLKAALQWLASQMKERHKLTVDIDAPDNFVEIDDDVKALLFDCVRELLFNTAKYAGVDTAGVVMREEGDGLRLIVEDEGCGFAVGAGAEDHRSSGVGLFSIRERLAAVEGDLNIETAPGKGCRVDLWIPQRQVAEPERRSTLVPEESRRATVAGRRSGGGRQIRVLVVDDHVVVREGIAAVLEADLRLHVIDQASDGIEAIGAVERHRPDIVLMDLNMPRMNGIEATRELRRRWPEVVVVGLSVQDDETTAQAMRDAGAAAFLPKAGDSGTLIETIRQLVPDP